jgi:hypothetical protein
MALLPSLIRYRSELAGRIHEAETDLNALIDDLSHVPRRRWALPGCTTLIEKCLVALSGFSLIAIVIYASMGLSGQTKRPFSRRFASSHSPLPSQYMALK